MILKDLFKKIATMSGISESETEKLIQQIGNAGLLEIADEISNPMTAEKFTFDAAINNTQILNTIKAQVLNGVDSQIKNVYKDFEFTDEDKNELESEKSTFKKIDKLAAKIKDKELQKSKASGTNAETLKEEISKLNAQMRKIKDESENKIKEVETARKTDKVNWNLDKIYGSKEYATDSIVGKDISILAAKQKMEQALRDKGVSIESTDDGNVFLKTTAGAKYFEDAKELSVEEFITKRLLENKLLKVSDSSPKVNETRTARPTKTADGQTDKLKTFFELNQRQQEEAAQERTSLTVLPQ